MRVGLVIYGVLDSRSGGYLYDRKLVEHLRSAGDRVEIISLPWRSYPRRLADNFRPGLLSRLQRLDVDVLLQDELNHPSLFLLNRRLRTKAGWPVVSIVHHLRISEAHGALARALYGWVERAYLRSVNAFIFNSRTTWEVVSAHVRSGMPGVVAVPGRDNLAIRITPDEIERRAREPGPLRVLFAGSVTVRKGLHTLLAALDRLDPASWELTVAGGLEAEPAYARRQQVFVRAKGWGERVRFAGFVGPGDLAVLLLRHHVLAGPSQYEGYGIAYLEALGAGLPVIASTGGAAREFIRPGENGFLVEPEDSAAVAQALATFHGDRPLLARVGVHGLKTFLAQPTWEESMKRARNFLVGLG